MTAPATPAESADRPIFKPEGRRLACSLWCVTFGFAALVAAANGAAWPCLFLSFLAGAPFIGAVIPHKPDPAAPVEPTVYIDQLSSAERNALRPFLQADVTQIPASEAKRLFEQAGELFEGRERLLHQIAALLKTATAVDIAVKLVGMASPPARADETTSADFAQLEAENRELERQIAEYQASLTDPNHPNT